MRVAFLALVLLVTGCAVLKFSTEEPQIVSEIVEVAVETARAPSSLQRDRLAAALEAFASRPDDASRLRAAVLLATLPLPFRDEARAAALLEPLAARRPETHLVRFASLFQAQLTERQSVAQANGHALRAAEQREEALRRQVEAGRANERAMAEREGALRRQVEALRTSEREMAEREVTLRRQIEALRSSERGIIERERRLGTKGR